MITLKNAWIYIMLCAAAIAPVAAAKSSPVESTARIAHGFDFNWKFLKADANDAHKIDYNDANWLPVNLPHDWSIEGPFAKENAGGKSGGYVPLGIGWYRKHFSVNPDHKARKAFIQFDGIYKNSDVWINGHHLGKRWCGYIGFQYDLTEHINWDSPNLIAVRVDNSKQTCRWYSGSGIYRHVWLTIADKLHVAHWGAYVTTPEVSADSAAVNIKTAVQNEYTVSKRTDLRTVILDRRGRRVAEARSNHALEPGEQFEFSQNFVVNRPILWSADSPNLYHAHTLVFDNQKLVDKYVTPFGVRRITWDSNKGLFVNDKPVLLKGVCIHHDLGSLGAAFGDRAMERRLEILKDAGCNAIRTSHNPPAPGLLDMCDRMGFLVIDEAFDKWGGANHPTWSEDWKTDLTSMLRRDRNHPSIILWSVGNEVRQQRSGDNDGPEMLKMLVDFVHQTEPTRKVTCGAFPQYNPAFVKEMDIAALNYQEQWFDEYRSEDPNIIILSSESYVYYRGKGDTHKAFHPVNPWLDALNNDFVVGTFYWTGIDYLGEAVAGWPFHGWNCSLIDTCGFRKPVSYLHQSLWSDQPMVHIAVMDDSLDVPTPTKSHWDWPKMVSHWTLPHLEAKDVKVVTFTNCQTVELFVNDKSHGTKSLADFEDRMMTWKIPYEPGIIKAIAKGPGRILRVQELQTAGKPARILLIPDRDAIRADGQDLCHVEVVVIDANGILVPHASNLINFHLTGPAKIVGVDNGDLTSEESYKTPKRKAYYGKCLVILQSTGKLGRILLTAKSPGLATDGFTIKPF